MRISDWSSDVCSSELPPLGVVPLIQLIASKAGGFEEAGKRLLRRIGARPPAFLAHRLGLQRQAARDQRKTARRRIGFDGACLPPGVGHLLVEQARQIVACFRLDRKSAVWGKSVSVRVDLGGRRIIKKKKTTQHDS